MPIIVGRLTLSVLIVTLSAALLSAGALAGDLTLPFSSQARYDELVWRSWLDHTAPLGFSDTNPTMTRYDGTTGHSYDGHTGVDFPLHYEAVLAPARGKVVAETYETCGGNILRLYHEELGYSTLYMHLDSYSVPINSTVERGQQIAVSGNTGRHTYPVCIDGPHLHFTARNGQTGSDNLDPYGWSGTGNDPWAPGQGFGHLFAIRLGVKGGAGVWANEGTLTAPGEQEDATATSFAMAGARIGTIRNGNAYAKDGQLNAPWVLEYTGASAIAMSGRRIGIITSSGVAKVKEGDLSASWYTIKSGASRIAVAHDPTGATPSRVGVLVGDEFWVQEGSLANPPVRVAIDATAIALGGGWMGYIHENEDASTKVGLYDYWTLQIQGGVTFMSLGGAGSDRRIGIIRNNIAIARVGEDPWVSPLYTGATKIRVNSGRVAILTNEGLMKAKEGSLNEGWTPLSPNVTDIQLN